MSVLRWQLLPQLGRTLLKLAGLLGAPAYADHYARDLGLPAEPAAAPSAATATAGAGGSAAVAAPPDMFCALQQLLAGQREGGQGGGAGSGGAVPLLAAQRAVCVQRSVDLLAAYSLLAEAAASIAATLSLEAAQVGAGLAWLIWHCALLWLAGCYQLGVHTRTHAPPPSHPPTHWSGC